MKKLLIVFAFIILVIGTVHAVTITEGEGISFNVQDMQDGSLVQITCDGYLTSNGDGTYYASCPDFIMPVFLHNSVVYVKSYDGTSNKFTVYMNGNSATHLFSKEIREYLEIPQGTYTFSLSGKSTKPLVHTKFTLTGTKQSGPDDFTIDASQLNASGYATLKVSVNGIEKFKKTYTFGSYGKKVQYTPTPPPTPIITPKPIPTPQPTKSPAQIWAERNCWWYR